MSLRRLHPPEPSLPPRTIGRGSTTDASGTDASPPATLLTILTLGVGVMVANLYYAQPLVALIAPEIGVSRDLAGSIVSVAQVGYGLGLFLLVPVADLVENKRLVLTLMGLTTLGLVGVATSAGAASYFAATLLFGLCATGAQVLLPYVAYLVPEARRGRVTGKVMAGVLTGIMLARPAALFISASFGWRAVFWTSAGLLLLIGLMLARWMPPHRPAAGMRYWHIIATMLHLPRAMPALCWRSAYGAGMFGAFNMFWTAAPLMLADRFGLGEHAIGLFALAGAGGAFAAPFAGRFSDRGWEHAATAGAMAVLALAFLGTIWGAHEATLPLLALFAVLLDAAVQTNSVVSRRTVFGTPPATRGRVNALYMTSQFAGGATGSILGTVSYHWGGWAGTAGIGVAVGLLLLGLLLCELLGARRVGRA
jgi:predicted MFS family arabinose efflux permease